MTPCADLQVGPLCFRFETDGPVLLNDQNWAYTSFIRPATDDPDPLVQRTLSVRLHRGGLACPDREPLFAAGQNWAVWQEAGGGYLFCSGFARQARALCSCRVDAELKIADLYVEPSCYHQPFRYPLDQVLSWGLLGQCGGVLLHAAVVEKDGEGIVFAGHSGAGKSTLSAFCHEAGWSILNDDRAMVFPRAGHWMVAGTPWHGTGRYAVNREVPLRAVYLLKQDRRNEVIALPPQECLRAMLNVASIPWFEANWSEQVLSNLEKLNTEVPLRRFHFTRSREAVNAIDQMR